MAETLVLCYHAVSADWPSTLAVSPELLESQLRQVLRRGYAGTTFTEAALGRGPERGLAVTFDDAYRSTHRLALGVLERLGLPGTVFVPTAHVGTGVPMSWPGIDGWSPGRWENELICMDRDELADLRGAGWEVGSHTRTHPHLTRLAAPALAEELAASKRETEALTGAPCTSIAYPYGDVDGNVARAAGVAGYDAGAVLVPYGGAALRYPRVGVYPADVPWRLALKTTAAVRRLGIGRLRHPVTALRGS